MGEKTYILRGFIQANCDSHKLIAPKSKYSRAIFSVFSDRPDGYNVEIIIENSINSITKNEG